jgi:hypothetical protein
MRTINITVDEETVKGKVQTGRTWKQNLELGVQIPADGCCPECGTPLDNGKCVQPSKH